MAKTTLAPLPAGTPVGQCVVERVVATGGSGIVYQGVNGQGRRVLLKEFAPAVLLTRAPGERQLRAWAPSMHRLEPALRHFLQGVRWQAAIRHPSVVPLWDVVWAHGTAVLVMPFIPGFTLQALFSPTAESVPAPVSTDTLWSIAVDLLDAVDHLHTLGLLHLDLKPSNVLIAEDGTLRLLDFETVHSTSAPMRQARVGRRRPHTPGYSAPETTRADPTLGPWSDLYSVGACLYMGMTGHPPPPADHRRDTDTLQAEWPLLEGRFPATLVQLVRDCLALQPTKRPGSAQQARLRALEAVAWSPAQ